MSLVSAAAARGRPHEGQITDPADLQKETIMTEIPQSPAPASDPFLDWLNTGTTKRATVPIYADQEALAEVKPLWDALDRLQAQLEDAEGDVSTHQRAIGEKPPLLAEIAALEAQIEPLEERIERSRSVWTLRALEHDEVEQIDADHPEPFMPTPTQEQATTAKGKARFQGLVREWQGAMSDVKKARVLAQISKAVVQVEMTTGTVTSMPVERIEKMLTSTFGRARFELLNKTLDDLMTMEEAPDRPFLSSNSGSTLE